MELISALFVRYPKLSIWIVRVLQALAVLALLFVGAVYMFGKGYSVGKDYADAKALQEKYAAQALESKEIAEDTQQSQAAAASAVTVYVDKIRTVYRTGATIEKEIPVYVPIESACVLPAGWRGLHDAAAQGEFEESIDRTAFADGEPVDAQTALYGVSANYAACHENSAKLTALQSIVREYQGRGDE